MQNKSFLVKNTFFKIKKIVRSGTITFLQVSPCLAFREDSWILMTASAFSLCLMLFLFKYMKKIWPHIDTDSWERE